VPSVAGCLITLFSSTSLWCAPADGWSPVNRELNVGKTQQSTFRLPRGDSHLQKIDPNGSDFCLCGQALTTLILSSFKSRKYRLNNSRPVIVVRLTASVFSCHDRSYPDIQRGQDHLIPRVRYFRQDDFADGFQLVLFGLQLILKDCCGCHVDSWGQEVFIMND
jgi:hypothetical protein